MFCTIFGNVRSLGHTLFDYDNSPIITTDDDDDDDDDDDGDDDDDDDEAGCMDSVFIFRGCSIWK